MSKQLHSLMFLLIVHMKVLVVKQIITVDVGDIPEDPLEVQDGEVSPLLLASLAIVARTHFC